MINSIEKILNEYEELRKISEKRRKESIIEVYKTYPELKQIDTEIRDCGVKCMNKIMSDPSSAQGVNNYIRAEMKKLKEKRYNFMIKNNIDPKFDKNKYNCNICKDTGFIENKKCKCFIQHIINDEFNNSNMGEKQRLQTFDRFNLDYYSKTEKESDITYYDRMKKIYNVCVKFSKDFENAEKSLLFYGHPGTGKTFMSCCIANELMKKGKTVMYGRASRIFELFEKNHFGKGNTDQVSEIKDRIYNCDLLIVDDLGTEFKTRNTPAFLFDFFDERISNNKKIIINTNYSITELTQMYTSRFSSRVYENFLIFKFLGDDIRVKK